MSVDVERVEKIGGYLLSMGGTAPKADVRQVVGLDKNQASRCQRAMIADGWLTETRAELSITPSGRARFGGLRTADAGDLLSRHLDGWPARHRALAQLIACAVIARAAGCRPFPSFAVVGDTGTGKTATAAFVARVFGLDPDATTVPLTTVTDRPSGRREKTDDGWRFTPSPWTRLPLVCLDEWDKAPDQARRDLLGTALAPGGCFSIEDAVIDLAPVPVITANPPERGDRLDALGTGGMSGAVRRRCITLDTGRRGDVPRSELARVTAAYSWRPEHSETLPVRGVRIATETNLDAAEDVEAAAEATLTPEGLKFWPGAAVIEPLVRARLALMPEGTRLDVVVSATMADYLTVTESIPGRVRPGWDRIVHEWANAVEAEPDPVASVDVVRTAVARASAARASEERNARDRRTERARDEDRAVAAAHTLAEQLRLVEADLQGQRMPGATAEERAAAKGVRAVLRKLRDSAAHASTARTVEDLTARAVEPLARGEALLHAVRQREQDRRNEEQQRRRHDTEQKRGEQQQRAAQKAQQAAYRQQLRSQLAALREELRPLEDAYRRTTTRPGEQPVQALERLRLDGVPVLTFEAANGGRTLTGALVTALTGIAGRWSDLAGRSWPGTATTCDTFAQWGQQTRSVLLPALRDAHTREDALTTALGVNPRSSRPSVR